MAFDFSQAPNRLQTNSIKWTHYPPDIIPLWVADMDFQAPSAINEALARAVAHGVHGYEFPSRQLREIVATRMENLYRWKVQPEWVIATPGIIAGFNAAAWTICEPTTGILTQPPVYPPFLSLHKNISVTRRDAPLRAVKLAQKHIIHYEIDFEQFKAAFKTDSPVSMFLLCNPHNPTGRAFSRAELLKMAEICLKHDTLIVSDEIHSELTLPPTRHIPIASLAPEIAAKSITLIAPSKTFNVPGLFTGFAIIPADSLRRKFRHETERLCMHVNSLGLVAAEAAYSGACDAWLDSLRHYLAANRDLVSDFVCDNLPGVRVTQAEATYLAWLDFRSLNLETSPHKYLLEKAKVALNEGKDFGEQGEGFARLNFGCPRPVLEQALQQIKTALDN